MEDQVGYVAFPIAPENEDSLAVEWFWRAFGWYCEHVGHTALEGPAHRVELGPLLVTYRFPCIKTGA